MQIDHQLTGFRQPQAIAVSNQLGAVVDAGNHRIVLIDLTTAPPAPSTVLGFEGSNANQEGLLFPGGLCFLNNQLVIADSWNHHLDLYGFAAGIWSYGSTLSLVVDGLEAGHLADVIAEGPNTVLVLDAGNKRLLRVNIINGDCAEVFSNAAWSAPSALASGGGYLWVSDSHLHRIFRYDAAFAEISFGGFGSSQGQLQAPRGVAFDATTAYLYVSEGNGARVSVFDAAGGFKGAIALPSGVAHELQKIAIDSNGRLLICDGGGNRVYVVSPGAPDRQPFSEPRTLDYGAVGLGYRALRSVAVRNPSTTVIQLTAATVSGTLFSIDASVGGFPKNIPANGSTSIPVVFAPNQIGLSVGQLRLDFAQAEIDALTATMRGEGYEVPPASIALVVDKSGSMAQSSGSMSKIDRMKLAAAALIDVASWKGSNELSIVNFSTYASSSFPRTQLDTETATAAKTSVLALSPSGVTSIGAGLQQALAEFSGTELVRKEIIVLSDGMENRAPLIDSVAITDPNTRIFAVGLGLPEFLDAEKLERLATSNGGYFQLTDEDDALLPKFFLQILGDVQGEQMVLDPKISLGVGESTDIPVYFSDADFRATFMLSWEGADSQFEITLIDPEGRILPSSEYWHHTIANRYQVFRIPFRGTRWNRPGRWSVRVRFAKGSAKRETALLTILAASDVQVEWKLLGPKTAKHTSKEFGALPDSTSERFPHRVRLPGFFRSVPTVGAALRLAASVVGPNVGAKLREGYADLYGPARSLVELMKSAKTLDLDRQKRAPERKKSNVSKIHAAEFGISKSGRDAALKISPAIVDGVHHIQARIQGVTRHGHVFQRERLLTFQVVRAQPKVEKER